MRRLLKQSVPFLLLILLSYIWGTSFFMIKNGLENLPPDVLAGFRMIFGTLFFIPFAIIFFKKTPFKKFPIFLLIGITGNAIPAILFSIAQTQVYSSISGIINSISPLFTFLLGIFFFGIVFKATKLVGVLVGLVGVVFLIFIRSDGSFEANFIYGLLIVLATGLYGLSSNIAGKYTRDIHPIVTATWSMIPMGVLYFLYIFFFTDAFHYDYSLIPLQYSIFAVIYLGLVATGMGTFIYFKLINMRGALFASTVTYFMPLVAIGWGLIAGEDIHSYVLLGLILIFTSIYFIGKK